MNQASVFEGHKIFKEARDKRNPDIRVFFYGPVVLDIRDFVLSDSVMS